MKIKESKHIALTKSMYSLLRLFKFNPTFYFKRSHFHLQGLEGHEGPAARTSSEVTISTDCGQIAKSLSAAIKICWSLLWPFSSIISLFILSSFLSLSLRYESSTLILYKELSSHIFQSLWVRHAWHPSRSPLFAMYKGINALYWPSITNYQLLPPHSVLYWPSTQLHHLVTHSWANWI